MADEQESWVPKVRLYDNEKDIDGVKCRPMRAQGNESDRAIPLTHSTIRKYRNVQAIRLAAMLAGQDERMYLPGTRTGAEADMALSQVRQTVRSQPTQASQGRTIFARGDEVVDLARGQKAIVLKTVAYTEKGTPIYRVGSQKTGEKWLVSEKKLRKK